MSITLNVIKCCAAFLIFFSISLNASAELRECDCEGIEVIKSFNSPFSDRSSVHGLAFDNKSIWAAGYEESKIYELDIVDNELVIHDYINTPGGHATGITFLGKNIFVGDDEYLFISKIKTAGKTSGKVLKEFKSPGFPNGDCVGLTTDGKNLWNADFNWNDPNVAYIHKLKKNGTLIKSYKAPGLTPEGLAYDGKFLWNVDWEQGIIYKLKESADELEVVYQCHFGGNPIGITFTKDFLVLTDQATQKIFFLKVEQ